MEFSETTLVFFYADWCPHSKKAKPEWKKIMDIGYAIDFVERNCTTIDLYSEYTSYIYPTMVLIKDNQTIKYKGYITETEVGKWLDSLDIPYKPPVMK